MDSRDHYIEQDNFTDPSGGTNRQYKDRLFKAIFGAQERRHLTLQVYNVLNQTSYMDSPDFKVMTIDNVVYMGMKNDVSFLLDQVLNLWEQQSTYNPNMPLRFMLYYAHVMERYVKTLDPKKGDIYSSALVRLPTPRMVLFYNGPGKMPQHLYLSNAFMDGTDPDVQTRVRVININSGQDRILEACKPLRDYTTFVEAFRRYREMDGITDRDAANKAIAELDAGDVKDYLLEHKAEVVDMLLTEYDEEKTLKAEYYAGERAGLEQGLRAMLNFACKSNASITDIVASAADFGVTSEEDLRARASEMGIQLPE